MAEVFRARLHGPEGFSKDLALKLILPHYSDDQEFVQMFIHEATLAARLDHANIVRIQEFDLVDGRYYLAMELVDGRDLRQILARANQMDRHLSVVEAVVIGIEICKGLAYAHGELTPEAPVVIHRDISPHNVILSRAGEVKITDLGIAKLASGVSATRTGVVKGKVAYMAPEQAAGLPLDPRSDLFSVGCVLWEMLTGQRLFTGTNDLVVLERLRSEVILPPSVHNPAVPERLDELILHALRREVSQRIGSASLLGRELERVLRTLPEFDRTTLLGELMRNLWQGMERRGGTGLMPLPVVRSPEEPAPAPAPPLSIPSPPAQDGALAEPKPLGAALKEGPDGSEGVTFVEPLGSPTQDRSAGSWARGRRAFWIIPTLLVLVGLALGLRFLWTGGPETSSQHLETAIGEDAAGPGELAGPARETAMQLAWAARRTPLPEAPVAVFGRAVGVAYARAAPLAPRPSKPVLGRLDLNAIPWASVYWNGRLLGDTPLEGLMLPVGDQILQLENSEIGKSRRIKVRIRARQSHIEVVDLR
jgi:serine/threonine-protein kinase